MSLKPKELTQILAALNCFNDDLGFKYPIGNKEFTEKVRKLESDGIIIYDALNKKWNKRTNNILKRLQG